MDTDRSDFDFGSGGRLKTKSKPSKSKTTTTTTTVTTATKPAADSSTEAFKAFERERKQAEKTTAARTTTKSAADLSSETVKAFEREKKKAEIRERELQRQIAKKTAKYEAASKPKEPASAPAKVAAPPSPPPAPGTCEITIRLPNGRTLKHSFASSDKLAAVIDYIAKNRDDQPADSNAIELSNTYPIRIFKAEEHDSLSLADAGFKGSAFLRVKNVLPVIPAAVIQSEMI